MTATPSSPAPGAPEASGEWTLPWPLDLPATLGPLSRGPYDPTTAAADGYLWRAASTPQGPGALRLAQHGAVLRADGWGPGAAWLVEGVPALVGAGDRPETFVPGHPVLAEAARRNPGLRIGACRLVFEMLAAAILEQQVTSGEAHRAWRWLVRRHGSPAPGPAPAGLTVAPAAAAWRRIPSWDWHRAGVAPRRARVVLSAAEVASRLERTLQEAPAAAERVLRQVPGVGAWTAAEVLQRAHGDPDAVSYGDFHMPGQVGWALAGRRFDDEELRRFLQPWAGQRGRVVRLALASGIRPPRFGPRYAGRDYRAI